MPASVPQAYPILLDVTRSLAVIVGGGPVAARKATGLLAAGAGRVRCVAPDVHPEMPPGVERVPETFRPEHLDGAALVFAATDSPDVNDAVVREAHRRGALVNRADASDDRPGDFTVPALWRSGAVTVAVSAGSAALAARIRDDLARHVSPALVAMAEAMRTLRPRIVTSTLPPQARQAALRSLTDDDALALAAAGGPPAVWQWLVARHPALGDPPAADGDSNTWEGEHQ